MYVSKIVKEQDSKTDRYYRRPEVQVSVFLFGGSVIRSFL